MLEEFDEWGAYWFDWLRPWRDIDVNYNIVIWTRWVGIPLHVWSTRFFSMVSAKFGMFIRLDESSENKSRLDFARVLISTGLNNLNEVFEVRIDGKSFTICVTEEVCSSYSMKEVREVNSGDDSDSQWSDEEQNSDGPADARITEDPSEVSSINCMDKSLRQSSVAMGDLSCRNQSRRN